MQTNAAASCVMGDAEGFLISSKEEGIWIEEAKRLKDPSAKRLPMPPPILAMSTGIRIMLSPRMMSPANFPSQAPISPE